MLHTDFAEISRRFEQELAANPAAADLLRLAFSASSIAEKIAAARQAVELNSALALARLCLADALAEVGEFEAALTQIDAAVQLAPNWELAHYEAGKMWLRYDELERAGASFRRAVELQPTFVAAWSNLGAALGEMDPGEEALAAFLRAAELDPQRHTVHNNIGVVYREMGRPAESEAALRRVLELAPEFVFGHYNLGHTLFLQGRYADAVAAYAGGQQLDPSRNARQAARLALARLAAGDAAGAARDFSRCLDDQLAEAKEPLLAEILAYLFTFNPQLAGAHELIALIGDEKGG